MNTFARHSGALIERFLCVRDTTVKQWSSCGSVGRNGRQLQETASLWREVRTGRRCKHFVTDWWKTDSSQRWGSGYGAEREDVPLEYLLHTCHTWKVAGKLWGSILSVWPPSCLCFIWIRRSSCMMTVCPQWKRSGWKNCDERLRQWVFWVPQLCHGRYRSTTSAQPSSFLQPAVSFTNSHLSWPRFPKSPHKCGR